MKKRAFAIVFLLASLVTYVQAEEKNGWYLGTTMGWSSFNPLKYNIYNTQKFANNFEQADLSAPILGFFLGYDFSPYVAFEIENDTNGFLPHHIFRKTDEQMQINNFQFATKLSYPVTEDFHFYTRVGGKVSWNDLTSKEHLKTMFSKESSVHPIFSLGAEYIFNSKFITRLDYSWKNTVKNIIEDMSIRPSVGDVVLSFGWKFGSSNIDDIFGSDNSELVDRQYSVLNEYINFPFNSSELKPISYDKLQKLDEDIKKMNLKNFSIVLSGHSDRIGNEEYNQKLSEDRAYSIKNYLTSKGFSRNQITVQGMGSLYSLTHEVCKNIENKPLLISCLAPDRRVEIEVLSTITS